MLFSGRQQRLPRENRRGRENFGGGHKLGGRRQEREQRDHYPPARDRDSTGTWDSGRSDNHRDFGSGISGFKDANAPPLSDGDSARESPAARPVPRPGPQALAEHHKSVRNMQAFMGTPTNSRTVTGTYGSAGDARY
jgi:hypothetical protein